MIVGDDGAELTFRSIHDRTKRTAVDWHDIPPGRPQQNAFVESRIGRRRADDRRRSSQRAPVPQPAGRSGNARAVLQRPQCGTATPEPRRARA